MTTDPVLHRQDTPDHGSGFWDRLDESIAAAGAVATEAPTRPLPRVGDDRTASTSGTAAKDTARRERRPALWPLGAAAAMLALVGLGLVFFGGSSPETTDVVSGSTVPDVVEVPAVAGEGAGGDGEDTAVGADSTPADASDAAAGASADGVETLPSVDDADPVTSAEAIPTATQELTGPATVPSLVAATGVELDAQTTVYPPADTTGLDGLRFLGTSPTDAVSWFATAGDGSCAERDFGRMWFADSFGNVNPVRDPNPAFSGEVTHFSMAPDGRHVSWVAACDRQLELYVATVDTVLAGELSDVSLAWVGRGSPDVISMIWSDGAVDLNSFNDEGLPFAVSVDLERLVVVAPFGGTPVPMTSKVLGATPDGSLSWYNEASPDPCTTTRVWTLRSPGGEWSRTSDGPLSAGNVRFIAVDPAGTAVAWTDGCGSINNAVVGLGRLGADGTIEPRVSIEVGRFGLGAVSLLEWTADDVLRIHLHDDELATGTLKFEWRRTSPDGGRIVLLSD